MFEAWPASRIVRRSSDIRGCIRQGGVEAPVLWGRVANYVSRKSEEKCKARGWGPTFGDENDNDYVLRCMMWADNYWTFCSKKERLVCMVSDIIAELLELDMEPKPESLWRSGTHQAEETKTLSVENRGRAWDLPFVEVFDVLGYRFHRDGNGYEGADRTLCKGFASWWQIHLPVEGVPMKTKCRRVLGHVFSAALNGSGRGTTLCWIRCVHGRPKSCVLPFRARMYAGESWVGYRQRTALSLRITWRKMGLPTMAEKVVDNIGTTMNWAVYDGEVPVMRALRAVLGWRTTSWWRSKSAWGVKDPANVARWKYKFGFHNGGVQWGYSKVEVGGRRKRLDTASGTRAAPQK